MQWEINYTSNSIQSYADITDLKQATETQYPDYALCLPRYSKMDGSYSNVASDLDGDCGYVSGYMSDADGNFVTAPQLTVYYERVKSSDGIHLIGNRLSGDYADDVTITWYRNGEQIETEDFYPDDVDFTCSKKVARFDTIVITFNHTVKPYRYIWLAMASVLSITSAGGLQVIYPDIATGAKEDSTPASDDAQSFVVMSELQQDDLAVPAYALCLPRYSKMDGSFINAPDTMDWEGFISQSVSDEYGVFADPPVIIVTFGDTYSSTGITLKANAQSGDYCNSVNIKWYQGTTLLADQDFTPDSVEYFCEYAVDFFDKVVVTFNVTSKPYRYAFLAQIDYGTTRIYTASEITDASCILEVSPISEVLSINEFSFDFKSNAILKLQDKQLMQVLFNQALICNMYIKKGFRKNANFYHVDAQDAIGVLDGYTFMGGIYVSISLGMVIAAIFYGTGINYAIDDSFTGLTLTGYLPICTRREALAQIGFVIGAIIDTSYDDKVNLYPYPATVQGTIDDNSLTSEPSLESSDVVTGVDMVVHKYTAGTEQSELYNDTLTGTETIYFSGPMHALAITGGTIGESGVNYAVITGTGSTVVLTGYAYTDTQTIISHRKDNVKGSANIVSVSAVTLVNSSNAAEMLERVAAYYEDNTYLSGSIVLGDNEPGLLVDVDTGYAGTYTGIITKCDMHFGAGKILADVEVE